MHDATKLDGHAVERGLDAHRRPRARRPRVPGDVQHLGAGPHRRPRDHRSTRSTSDGLLVGRGSAAPRRLADVTAATSRSTAPTSSSTPTSPTTSSCRTTSRRSASSSPRSRDGTWTAVFRDELHDPVQRVRRAGSTRPACRCTSALAAGTNAFPLTTTLDDSSSTIPRSPSRGTTTIARAGTSPTPSARRQRRRVPRDRRDAGAALARPARSLVDRRTPDVVTAAPLVERQLRRRRGRRVHRPERRDPLRSIVKPDCTQAAARADARSRPPPSATAPHRRRRGERRRTLMYAWIVDERRPRPRRAATRRTCVATADARARWPRPRRRKSSHVRVAPLRHRLRGRRALASTTSDRPRQDRALSASAARRRCMGAPTLDHRQERIATSRPTQAFGVATRADGALLVVWHECDDAADGACCGVFGRVVRPTARRSASVRDPDDDRQRSDQPVGRRARRRVRRRVERPSGRPDRRARRRARILYPAYDAASAIAPWPTAGGRRRLPLASGLLRTRFGNPADAICRESRPIELVALGSRWQRPAR